MWILTSPGPVLGGRKKWLRPGSSYTIGRSSPHSDDGSLLHVIPVHPKWVSRQHLQIIVHPVAPGSGVHTSMRSKLYVKDLGTKFGSMIGDSTKIVSGASMDVTSLIQDGQIKVRLGARDVQETTFIIQWIPQVITFSSGVSDITLHEQYKKHLLDLVENMDIKVLVEIHPNTTFYLKPKDTKSSKLLYALVKQIPVVKTEFAATLAASVSAIEADYEAGFPDPALYLPDPQYAPIASRRNCFDGYIFIFCDSKQRDALLGAITAAGGKSEVFEMTSRTTPKDLANFASKYAKSGNVALIFKYPTPSDNPLKEQLDILLKMDEAARILGQYLLGNSEFVDAIIKGSASDLLQKRLPTVNADNSVPVEAVATSADLFTVTQSMRDPPPRRVIRRHQPKIMNFFDVVKNEPDMEIHAVKRRKIADPEPEISAEHTTDITPVAVELAVDNPPGLVFEEASEDHPEEKEDFAPLVKHTSDDYEEEIGVIDESAINRIHQLTLVETTIEVGTRYLRSNITQDPQWVGKPNFKAFVRRDNAPNNRPKGIRESVNEVSRYFQRRDRETMEMLENNQALPSPRRSKRQRVSSGSTTGSTSYAASTTPSDPGKSSTDSDRRSARIIVSDEEDDDEGEFQFRFGT